MRIKWQDLAARRIAEPYMQVLFPIMKTEDAAELAACMEKYTALPEDVQRALGYMRCVLESAFCETYSAYGQYSFDMLRHRMGHIPLMRKPLSFVGWGGQHNEIGPAYEIDGNCHIDAGSKMFYTDDDIRGNAASAEELAGYAAQVSSGITGVRAEQLPVLRTMNRDIKEAHWCISFRLDDSARKEICVNGQAVKPEEGRALFILPKAGQFDCMLGEMVYGDPENAFILAKHNFCMK